MSEEKKELINKTVEAATKVGDAADKVKDAASVVDGKTWPDVASEALEGLKAGIGDVAKVVHNISQELAESAPQIWNGLVSYHRAMAVGELLVSLIWLIVSLIFFYYGKKIFTKGWAEGELHSKEKPLSFQWPDFVQGKVAVGILLMIVCSSSAAFIIKDLPEGIGDVVVPERRAAIEIITVIKGGGDIPQR